MTLFLMDETHVSIVYLCFIKDGNFIQIHARAKSFPVGLLEAM